MTGHCLGEQEIADPGSARSVESEKNCTNPNKKAREIHVRAVRKTTLGSRSGVQPLGPNRVSFIVLILSEMRNSPPSVICDHSPMSWSHVNMPGEHGLSDEDLRDAFRMPDVALKSPEDADARRHRRALPPRIPREAW